MAKNKLRSMVSLSLSLVLMIGSAIPAAAADSSVALVTDTKTSVYEGLYYPAQPERITVYANGKEVISDNVKPIPADWANGYSKPYLPLRNLMEALGATVDYSLDDRLILITFGDTTVSFPIYSSVATVTDTKTGASHSYDMNPAPRYVNGRVLITSDVLSDCFGLLVSSGWSSISVIDLDAMMEGFDDHFSVMNKMLTVSNAQRNYRYDGKYEGKIDLSLPYLASGNSYLVGSPKPAGTPNSSISLPFEGTFTSEYSDAIAAGDFALKMKLDDISKLLPADDMNAAMLPLTVSALADFGISYIYDIEKHVVFIKCPLLTKYVLGMPSADWIKIDMDKMGMYNSMPILDTTDLTFSQLMSLVIKAQAQSTYLDYDSITGLLKTIEMLFSDASFTKTGSDAAPVYNLTISKNDLIDYIVKISEAFGETLTREEVAKEISETFGEFNFDLKLSVAVKNDVSYTVGIDFHTKLVDTDGALMQMDITGTESFPGKSAVEMAVKYNKDSNSFALTLKINSTSAVSSTLLSPEPPSGDKVVDVSELY